MRALDGVDLALHAGEVHALCGENGAGKSTLIKILGGVEPYGGYRGVIERDGRACRFRGPRDSLQAGIRIIFQELALAPDLSVAENVFLGREHVRGFGLDRERMQAEACRRLALLGLENLDPRTPVRTLPVGLRQMVEIARALGPSESGTLRPDSSGARSAGKGGPGGNAGRILILDEPTSALSQRETDALLAVLARLKAQGLAILYVSHKLEEVFAAADRISVLRNGRSMGTLSRAEADPGRVVSLMVGRSLEEVFPPLPPAPGPGTPPVLSVRDWSVPSAANPGVDLLRDVSFDLRPGEILGLAGLMGAGRTELVESLFGLGPRGCRGGIVLQGEPYMPSGPGHAVARGLALVPEDRRRHGLWLEKPIRENVSGACLARFSRFGVIDGDAEARRAAESVAALGVKAPHAEFPAGQLSGGNQQKVVLAKWLAAEPRVLFLDDPTRGVDIGAKSEIYRLIASLAARGLALILISSELDEVLRLSHRVLVLRGGRIAGEFGVGSAAGPADKQTILAASAGGG